MPHADPITPLPDVAPETRETTTALLHDLTAGAEGSADALFPLVYEELRRVAHRYLRAQQGHTLNTTALVHEAYLRLIRQDGAAFADQAHFRAVAARAMRHILVDYARSRGALKRGGGQALLTLDAEAIPAEEQAGALLALDEALSALAQRNERLGRVIEMRFFGGMTHEEIAAVFGITVRTVERDWQRARAHLRLALT